MELQSCVTFFTTCGEPDLEPSKHKSIEMMTVRKEEGRLLSQPRLLLVLPNRLTKVDLGLAVGSPGHHMVDRLVGLGVVVSEVGFNWHNYVLNHPLRGLLAPAFDL